MKKFFLIPLTLFQMGCASDDYYYQNNKKIYLTPVNSYSRALNDTDYYTNDRGTMVGVSNKILLKITSNGNIENLLTKYNLSLEKQLGNFLYLVKVANKNLTIDIANRLTEDDNIVYAQPDFIKEKVSR